MPTGCLTLLVLVAMFATGLVFVIFGALKSTDVYKTAITEAKRNVAVADALGTPIKEGLFVSGNTKVEGSSGEADLSIPISGPKAKGTIYAVAKKSAGRWTYSTLEVEVAGASERINLLRGNGAAPASPTPNSQSDDD